VAFIIIGIVIFIWGAYVPISLLFGEAI